MSHMIQYCNFRYKLIVYRYLIVIKIYLLPRYAFPPLVFTLLLRAYFKIVIYLLSE